LQLLVELERLLIVAEKYRQGGGGYHRTEGQLRRQLETSFAREAEVVFTTLSSSGREIFERLGHGFDTVVIDEAAQVSGAPLVSHLVKRCAVPSQ
jgi:superfamily I DNA and/or RNA helicase